MSETADENVLVHELIPGECYSFGEEGDDHQCVLVKQENKEFRATCKCGHSWTYDRNRDLHWMFSIWVSHLSYFKRKPMETL